jgi:xylulose-5-phosphate/fructose-6-phosphate phosphoketolase
MTVLNDMDGSTWYRCVNRIPQPGDEGAKLKRIMKDKLTKHRQYIYRYGQDMPEVRNWKWNALFR